VRNWFMSMSETTQLETKEIAESIRRLNSSELAQLVSELCEDNMGQKLQTALSYENLDRDFRNKE